MKYKQLQKRKKSKTYEFISVLENPYLDKKTFLLHSFGENRNSQHYRNTKINNYFLRDKVTKGRKKINVPTLFSAWVT